MKTNAEGHRDLVTVGHRRGDGKAERTEVVRDRDLTEKGVVGRGV